MLLYETVHTCTCTVCHVQSMAAYVSEITVPYMYTFLYTVYVTYIGCTVNNIQYSYAIDHSTDYMPVQTTNIHAHALRF